MVFWAFYFHFLTRNLHDLRFNLVNFKLPFRCPILVSYDSEWILVSSNSLSCTNASWEYFWYHSGNTTLVGLGLDKAALFNGGSELLLFDILKLSFQLEIHNRLNAKKGKQKNKTETAVVCSARQRNCKSGLGGPPGSATPRHGLEWWWRALVFQELKRLKLWLLLLITS